MGGGGGGGGGGGAAMLNGLGGLHDLLISSTNPLTTAKFNSITNNFFSHNYGRSYAVNLPLSSNSCSLMKFDSSWPSPSSYEKNVLGPVPSRIEVQKAIDDLHRLMMDFCTSDSETNGLEQMLYHLDPRMMQSFGHRRIYDAYHMLQTEPSVQRMVISISSDKAVWDAIVSNKAVHDLRGSLHTAREERTQSQGTNKEVDFASLLMKWILGITKLKVFDLIGKFGELVNEIFKPAADDQTEIRPTSELTDLVEEKVRSSLMLSVVILVIVVFTRESHEA